MKSTELQLTPTPTGAAIAYGETPVVVELGVGVPINGRWRWSFDGSIRPRSICSWSGKGTLSIACVGAYCHTTVAINGAVSVFLLAHELGHNFKNHHATRLNCGPQRLDI